MMSLLVMHGKFMADVHLKPLNGNIPAKTARAAAKTMRVNCMELLRDSG
jgi:hypothetical protein